MKKYLSLASSALLAIMLHGADANSVKAVSTEEESDMAERIDLIRPLPRIRSMQLHHWTDANTNSLYDGLKEAKRIYADTNFMYMLNVKKPIPAEGYLSAFVPGHHFRESVLETALYDITKGGRFLLDKKRVDMKSKETVMIYTNAPLEVMASPIGEYRQSLLKQSRVLQKRDLMLTVIRDDGLYEFDCFFTVDFSAAGQDKASNAVAAVQVSK